MLLAENIDTDNLILDHQYMVNQVVASYFGRCNHTELDEIRSDANVGLVLAAQQYDPDKNDNFEAYAYQRIRFAIKDGFRQRDHLSRSYRQKVRDKAPRVISLSNCREKVVPTHEDKNLQQVELRDSVRWLMRGMPLYLRRVIYLRFWRDMQLKQIAERLGVCQQTAVNQMRLAMQFLKSRGMAL